MAPENLEDAISGMNAAIGALLLCDIPQEVYEDIVQRFDYVKQFAKKDVIEFCNFKREYQRIESMNVRHYNIERYGQPVAITWVGADDDKIWDAYKKGEQLKRYYDL